MAFKENAEWSEVEAAETAYVAFTATWCAPCRRLKPEFAKASVQNWDKNFFTVDVDQLPADVLDLFKIQSVPTVYQTRLGNPVSEIHGRRSDDIIVEVRKLENQE